MAYKIRPGDTLSGIASRFKTSVSALAQANGIKNPNLIYAGRTLQIPGQSDGFTPAKPSSGGGGGTYTVRRGNTLGAIAGRHGTSVSALASANGIRNPNLIHVGQTLRIPGRSGTAPTAPTAPTGNNSTKTGPMAQRLANAARSMAQSMNTYGWCAKGVNRAMAAAGLYTSPLPSAYMYAARLAGDPRYREIRVPDSQLRSLPAGAVIVSAAYNSPGNPHGHIEVSLGNGMGASDHISPIATHGTQRVFIPVG